jgi:hypothetical protein
MIGGLKQTTSRLAIAAAAGLFTGGIALTPVQAADLGGDCCADLEERVAELEATTVRKGNRKVSVKLSGQVNRGILFWDDGEDSDTYFVDVENSNTRFRITGSASISPGRTAGFRIEADWFIQNNSSAVSNCNNTDFAGAQCMAQANTVGNSAQRGGLINSQNAAGVTDMRWSEVWFKDDRLGKLSLGKGDTASNGTSEVDLSGTSVAQYAGMADVGGAFQFRTSGGATPGGFAGASLGDAYSQNDGLSRRNRLRYDTPAIGGFTFSASASADDAVDGALRFKKEWNSVRCAWAGAIAHDTTEKGREVLNVRRADDKWIYSTSGSCLHTPSGLNLTLGYSETDEGIDDVDAQWFFIKAGISRRWNSHGKTSISVQYAENQNRLRGINARGGDLNSYGVAFVQKIDSAALELYVAWSHHELDRINNQSFQDLDFLLMGARMKF